jgi:hypothetical protein
MSNNNGKKWDVNVIIAILGIIVGAIVALATPEIRQYIGLEDKPAPSPPVEKKTPVSRPELKTIPHKIKTPPVKQAAVSKPPVIHKAKEPAGPKKCTIGDNKSQRIEEAETDLSIIFNEKYDIVTLTISPDGQEQITLPTVGIGSKEFASSTGVFLIHVLNVDWNRRTVTVQVSRKR